MTSTNTDRPDDGPVWVVRLLTEAAAPADVDSRRADLEALGAELVFLANVQDQLLGDNPAWGSVDVATYPQRSSIPAEAPASDSSIVVAARPIPSPPIPTDAPTWEQVPHPPTEEDGSVVVIHVIRFNEGGAAKDMVSYQDAAGRIAVPHGVRIDGWFGVVDDLAGDGRSWDQVRFNAFPSRAAFLAVVFDPSRLEAHRDHREVAIADTYTMVLRPLVNDLVASTA